MKKNYQQPMSYIDILHYQGHLLEVSPEDVKTVHGNGEFNYRGGNLDDNGDVISGADEARSNYSPIWDD